MHVFDVIIHKVWGGKEGEERKEGRERDNKKIKMCV